MSLTTDFFSDAGLIAPRKADFLTLIRDRYEADTGLTPDWNRSRFLAWITENMAHMLGLLGESLQAVYDARSPASATGVQLENLALIAGLQRKEATYSRVTLTLGGTAGTVIPTGKLVTGGGPEGKSRWVLQEDVVLPADAVFQAEDAGAVEVEAGYLLWQITTPVSGWTTVTNAEEADAGRVRETDAQLRARRQIALASASSSSVQAIRTALIKLELVDSVVVLENDTSVVATVGGVSMQPHSFAVILYPSTLTDAEKSTVAATIYRKAPAGIYSNGAESAEVTGRDGYEKTIRWAYAAALVVNVAATVVLQPGYVLADVEQPLKDAVALYFDTLSPYSPIYRTPLIALAATIPGIADATFTLNGGAGPITPTASQVPTLGTNTVV